MNKSEDVQAQAYGIYDGQPCNSFKSVRKQINVEVIYLLKFLAEIA